MKKYFMIGILIVILCIFFTACQSNETITSDTNAYTTTVEFDTTFSSATITSDITEESKLAYNFPKDDIAGRFYCEDNIDMSGIEVKICVWHQSYDEFMQKVLFSVKTDENGVFHFTPPDGEWFGEVNYSTIASGYGVLYENRYFDDTLTLQKPFELVQVANAEISFDVEEGLLGHRVDVYLKDENGTVMFGGYELIESYSDDIVQKILADERVIYSVTVVYGDKQVQRQFEVPTTSRGRYSTRTEKIDRMLKIGIIDQAQYDELITSNR